MKVAVKKDGHSFFTHVNRIVVELPGPPTQDKTTVPSKQDSRGKAALKQNPGFHERLEVTVCVSEPEAVIRTPVKQGSFSAVLENKIQLSYSFYGPTGEHKGLNDTMF